MENCNAKRILVCDFFPKDQNNKLDLSPCCECPFGYTFGEPEDTCPEASSVEDAISMLDDVAVRAKFWADKLTAL